MKKTITTNCEVSLNDDLKGDIYLDPNTIYQLVIDYPLANPATIKIETGNRGMGTNSLLGKICKEYRKIYDKEDKFLKENPDSEKEPPYGIWGHDIGDLAIESITVDHEKKTIKIDVGS